MWFKEEIARAAADFRKSGNPALSRKAMLLEFKDRGLRHFQQSFGVSDAEAERAIKEWVRAHHALEWDLAEVTLIILERRQGPP